MLTLLGLISFMGINIERVTGRQEEGLEFTERNKVVVNGAVTEVIKSELLRHVKRRIRNYYWRFRQWQDGQKVIVEELKINARVQ